MCCGGFSRGGGGGGGGSPSVNSLAAARASGSTQGWHKRPPRRKSQRLKSIKVEAKTSEFKQARDKGFDQSFFGASNGFRKGKSKQRASRGSDTSRHAMNGSTSSW
ncbi:hypothetical protein FCIRC_12812 [Fusarium circinatum]|uniref:Uncharacterized protein n=1 Tax=Fusarium circinatum TaxID=48490 RepID=A0A8H5SXA8_FUSCI|nr:hypothetical protein FCIRC_12812 [Fusarium circinatum]